MKYFLSVLKFLKSLFARVIKLSAQVVQTSFGQTGSDRFSFAYGKKLLFFSSAKRKFKEIRQRMII